MTIFPCVSIQCAGSSIKKKVCSKLYALE
uniref:Uncharacterized protein n=1 Tax=Arundo donax TaxID=35708 RepID=A0A0A9A0N1_ARUDO